MGGEDGEKEESRSGRRRREGEGRGGRSGPRTTSPALRGSLGGPRAERPLGMSALADLLRQGVRRPAACAHGFIRWLRPLVAPGSAALCPQARLPGQHPFVRHQHLKMSNRFQRVRSGSLPSSPFSFFNSSGLCPSCKLPQSPWGWRRAVSLFPSQTSVSINSCARTTSSFWARASGRKCFVYPEGVGFLAPPGLVGPRGMAAALGSGSPGLGGLVARPRWGSRRPPDLHPWWGGRPLCTVALAD